MVSVNVEQLIKDFDMEILAEGPKNVNIDVNDINRPGLQLAGFYNYFAPERIQVIGKAEWSFLDDMSIDMRNKRIKKFFSFDIKTLIITRGLEPHEELVEAARRKKIWLMRTSMTIIFSIMSLTILIICTI